MKEAAEQGRYRHLAGASLPYLNCGLSHDVEVSWPPLGRRELSTGSANEAGRCYELRPDVIAAKSIFENRGDQHIPGAATRMPISAR